MSKENELLEAYIQLQDEKENLQKELERSNLSFNLLNAAFSHIQSMFKKTTGIDVHIQSTVQAAEDIHKNVLGARIDVYLNYDDAEGSQSFNVYSEGSGNMADLD